MRNLDKSVLRRRYLNEEMELEMTNSVGREFHTHLMRFEEKWTSQLFSQLSKAKIWTAFYYNDCVFHSMK